MQMINFNLAYARSIPNLATPLAAIAPAGVIATSLSTSQQNQVLNLVVDDKYDFASAAWFMTTQCTQTVRRGLQGGTASGWQNFLSECVGVSATDDRTAYWTKAISALSST
jgi:hypothetical protein